MANVCMCVNNTRSIIEVSLISTNLKFSQKITEKMVKIEDEED